jgi:gamma-glutamyltranspeptidase / glutathione hydrolase
MHNLRRSASFLGFLLLAPLALAACTTAPVLGTPAPALTTGGAAAANDPRVGPIGEAIMARGGSATDAALAMMLALAVVEPQSMGLGGGGLLVVGGPDGTVETFDGRETAPAAATQQWFLEADGSTPRGRMAATLSGLSIGVPGAVAMAAEAHRQHGRLPWADLFAPAIALARDGFPVTPRLSASLATFANRGGRDPDGRAMFYHADGSAPLPGEVVRLPELAATLEMIAREGPDSFYRGPFAESLAAEVAADTPVTGMTAADMANYRALERNPACTLYRLYRVCTMGPPSSGGVALLAMLKQLERFDLAALGPRSAVTWHLFIESQRLAYADREFYVGDPDHVPVPLAGLLDDSYLASRAALIDPAATMAEAAPGQPAGVPLALGAGQSWPEQGTTHFVAVGGDGSMASLTATVEGAFGSGLAYRGFYLNNELTDFAFAPLANDGRVVANAVAGGKRPASSMTPTVVYDPQGRPLFVVGAAGGGLIPPQTARAIIAVIDFHLPLEEALGLPFVMAVGGGNVLVEKGTWMEALTPELQRLGHARVQPFDQLLRTTGALRQADGTWRAAMDPRLADLVRIPPAPASGPAGPGQSEGLGPEGAAHR